MHASVTRVARIGLALLLLSALPANGEISSVTLKTSRNVSFF